MAQQAIPDSHAGSHTRNRLLAALSARAYGALRSELESVRLPHGQVLWEPDTVISHIYFPLTAVLSQLTLLADGTALETGIVGNEGFAGFPLVLDFDHDDSRMVVQVSGSALRLPSMAFQSALAHDAGELRTLLYRSLKAFLAQMAQTSACSRIHPLTERCARWLLHVHDRAGSDSFVLTQEFLADMLGVRRPSVTVVAGTLQAAQLIRYHRGTITVLNRAELEAAACECYAIIVSGVDRLVGPAQHS
jgi:CRP-like cAMP-binding protein